MTTTKSPAVNKLEAIVEHHKKFVAELETKMQDNAKKVFQAACKKFFDDNPEITSFGWRQFEPWLDGDETEFEAFTDYENVYVNGACLDDEYDEDSLFTKELTPRAVKVSELLKKLPSDLLKDIFGNGSEIIVSRDGIRVEEYSDG